MVIRASSVGAEAAAPAAATPADPSPYVSFAALEERVAAIGFRLTTANAAWCPVQQPQFGWIWGDPRLYDAERRPEALAAYGAVDRDDPFIAAIAPTSPAATVGMRVGVAVILVLQHHIFEGDAPGIVGAGIIGAGL